MSKSLEPGAVVASDLNQKTCSRIACVDPLPETKCCDDTCILEIARRDCNSNPAHKQQINTTPCGEISGSADEEPCESHYLKAKEAYNGILENIGCICKVLLSLNLDSCCVAPPAGSLRSKRSTSSMGKGLLADISRLSSARSSSCKLEEDADCSKKTCCQEASPTALKGGAVPQAKCDDSDKGGCCGREPSGTRVASCSSTPAVKTDCCSKSSASTGIGPTAASSDHEQKRGSGGCGRGIDSCCSDSQDLAILQSKSKDCSSKKCCSDSRDEAIPPSKPKDCSGDKCCSDSPDEAILPPKPKDCSSEKCCSDSQDLAILPPKPKNCSGEKCCSSSENLTVLPSKTKDCSSKKCCSDNLTILPPNPKDCSGEKCCSAKPSRLSPGQTFIGTSRDDPNGCCSSGERGLEEDISETCCTGDLLETPACHKSERNTTGSDEFDLEKGVFPTEHIVLSVQGMTCTGCEKKLYRSLDMMPEISNIKTSLLLAQAEFDLGSSSTTIDTINTIKAIEKATGFTCTKMTQAGHYLDLIVDGDSSEYVSKDLPAGVYDITALDSHTIRVIYQPKLVGARDLMSNPFFQSPKLAPIADRPLIASGRAHVRSMLFKTIVSGMLTIPVLIMAWAPLPEHKVIYGAISLVLATLVQFYIAGPWYLSAFNALFISRLIEMDLLVVLSTTTAYIYSIVAYAFLVSKKPLSTGSFFEASTLLVTLIMAGRLVSGFARQRAVESISIESLQSSTAILTDPKSHCEQEIDARLLQYQDIFKALPDTSIATDGTVIAGTSEVDESMITGEASLIVKKPGSPVVAGSINHSGTLTIRLTRLTGENTIKTIGLMVDEAKSSKTKIQDIADRVASYFIPMILIVTVVVFVVWVAIGKAVRGYDASTTCINAMTYAISALIVSCPCAIGLAVPMVLVVAGGVAAKHGLIFKTAETVEIARNLSHVIFDKTGTLTQGLLAVDTEIYPTGQREILASMLLGLTSNSKHPVSTAIATHLKNSGVQPEKVEKVVSIAGNGIEATWNGSIVRAGNPHWLGVEDSPVVKETLLLGVSMFCVSLNSELVAVFGLKDLLRPDAIQVINELKKRSIEVSIVSGDNQESVESVARALGVPQSHVRFRCSPADKQEYVKEMLAAPTSVVMFCGDGTNDAVALAQASIGMHIDGGTDIAQSAADTILIRPALSGIIILMDLSNAYFHRVVFNFTWSFIYNTFAILLAAGAFPNVRIPPEFAGLGEIVSVLPVIAIGMQLKWTTLYKAV